MSVRATTVKEALERWQKENGIMLSEATEVGLQFQLPPLEKMTYELGALVNCEKLSLSTNNIDRIVVPASLKNLKILALSRNNIRSLAGLEVLGDTLEELWISYNFVDKLRGIEAMKGLKKLYIAYNAVRDWTEFQRLAAMKDNLRELNFIGNPLVANMEESAYRAEVAQRLPFLEILDTDENFRS